MHPLSRYGKGENEEWGSWHTIGILAHPNVSLVTVDVDNSCIISGFNYDSDTDHVSLCIQDKTFWCQNIMQTETASTCLHHSPVGAALSYITGDETDNKFSLNFYWMI